MNQFDLLQKTELRIEGIELDRANLDDVAEVVADVIGLERGCRNRPRRTPTRLPSQLEFPRC